MAKVARYIDALSLRAEQINDQVRELIDHPGEKGRAAEHVVRGLIREILPKKFSIGTGFVVTASDRRSAQMDIVLFDEQLNAPLSLVGDLGIFPIECVYATLEVKTTLTKRNLREAAIAIGDLRKFKDEKRYVVVALEEDQRTKNVRLNPNAVITTPLAPRTYVFAFKTGMSSDALLKAMREVSDESGAFFHGVVVLDKGCDVSPKLHPAEGRVSP